MSYSSMVLRMAAIMRASPDINYSLKKNPQRYESAQKAWPLSPPSVVNELMQALWHHLRRRQRWVFWCPFRWVVTVRSTKLSRPGFTRR